MEEEVGRADPRPKRRVRDPFVEDVLIAYIAESSD